MAHPPPCITGLDTPLVRFSPMPGDTWSLRDAFEGTAIFGRSGSGKTSGSGAALAKSFLRAGIGGLVMCAKPDEADTWERYAAETGRSASIIRFNGDGHYRFNFLEYQMQRDGLSADVLATEVVNTLQTVMDVAGRAGGLEAASKGDEFWPKATRQLLLRAIDMLYATTGRVRLAEPMDFIESAPTDRAMMQDEHWRNTSFFAQVYRDYYATGGGANPPAPQDIRRLDQFWRTSFPTCPDKTQGNILITLQTDLEDLLRPKLRKIFSTDTNVVPELTHDGAIILMDFPTLTWGNTGVLAQMIMKYLWMRAAQRREVQAHTRPLFLWADECQYFLSGEDMTFQSTARSSRTATVLMTQNLPSFYSRIGGHRPEHTINAMMGNLRTKIFHQNDCMTTNEWAANLIGKTSVWRRSFGTNSGWNESHTSGSLHGGSITSSDGIASGTTSSFGYSNGGSSGQTGTNRGQNTSHSESEQNSINWGQSQGTSGGTNQGMQEQRDYAVEPQEFATDLLSGGPRNDNTVTGVVVLPGRSFERNGKHWMQIGFKQ